MSQERGVLFLFLSFTVLFLDAQRASACSCGAKPTVLAEFERADFVFTAKAVSMEKAEHGLDGVGSTKLIVESVFKGALHAGEEINFAQGEPGDCHWAFNQKDISSRYLFYLGKRLKGERLWTAYICGRNQKVDYAADDLLYLENLARVRGKTRLSGTLRLYQSSPNDDLNSYSSLAGKTVRVIGNGTTHELTTNQYGRYEIYDLRPGKYSVELEVPDGFKIEDSDISAGRSEDDRQTQRKAQTPSFQLTINPGKHTYADFEFSVRNAVRGRVFDPAGNGMHRVCLTIVPTQGRTSRHSYLNTDCTDEDGRFAILEITPGSYLLVANEDGKLSGEQPFRPIFYPGFFEREKAAIITIGAGQILEDIHINVPEVQETIRIEGVCSFSDGKPAADMFVKFQAENPGSGIEGHAEARTDSAGRFSMKILKGLKGTLYAGGFAYRDEYQNCPKIEEMIAKSGIRATLRTGVIEIRADSNLADLRLSFPFPGCRKAR